MDANMFNIHERSKPFHKGDSPIPHRSALIAPMSSDRVRDGSNTADVAERLVLTRLALGYKPSQLAKITGISPQALSNYENGRILISVTSANLYRKSFGVTLDWIYHGDLRALPHEFVIRLQGRVKTSQAKRA